MDNSWVYLEESAVVPPDAVIGGHHSDGSLLYVGRALHDGVKWPAKVQPQYKAAYMGLDGREYKKLQYEVLTGSGSNYKWVPVEGGVIPANAVIGGQAPSGEIMFIGRGLWKESLTVGKIQATHRCLYIPFNGGEPKLGAYEVLTYSMDQECRKSSSFTSTWLSTSGSCVPDNAVLLDEDKYIYVGRAFHKGVLLPALVTPDKACAYVNSTEGKVEKGVFEVLVGDNYRWEMAEYGNVPPGAVAGSRTDRDEPLYIARTGYLGYTTMGQVKQSDGCMYISLDGKQESVKSYEVLVYRFNEKRVACGCKPNK